MFLIAHLRNILIGFISVVLALWVTHCTNERIKLLPLEVFVDFCDKVLLERYHKTARQTPSSVPFRPFD